VTNVAETNRDRRADFPYTDAELAAIKAAVRNEAYPPQGRRGVGTVIRRPA
jgi:hypothetical protein